MTRIQGGLATLDLGINPVDQFLALFHVFAPPNGRICNASTIQQFFFRNVAKVCQAPVDGAGFSVFVVSVCEPQPSANAGAVAKAIISAARMNKRFILGLQFVTQEVRSRALIGSLRLHPPIRILVEQSSQCRHARNCRRNRRRRVEAGEPLLSEIAQKLPPQIQERHHDDPGGRAHREDHPRQLSGGNSAQMGRQDERRKLIREKGHRPA